ncbi:BNR repeat-containing protein [Plantibacter flavus]
MLAVCAIGVLALGSAAPASAATTGPSISAVPTTSVTDSVETLPYPVDTSNQAGWWRPLDVVDGVSYFAFNAPAAATARHEVHLASRAIDGTWTEDCLRASAGAACVTFADDNGHNQPSIVVDGAGTIHAFVSMHNEQWNAFRSSTPGDVTSLVDVTAAMPDLDAAMTYPVTARGPEGDVWVLVRVGTDAQGRREGVLYHFDLAAGVWERASTIAAATGYSFYPDDLEVDVDGRVHVLWEWGPFPADPARHLGSYAVYDPADGSLTDVAGTSLTGPVTPTTPGSVVWRPFGTGEAIGSYTPALQTAKLALDGTELTGIVYRFVEADETAYDVRYASWSNNAWTDESLIDSSSLGSGVSTVAGIDVTSAGGVDRVYAVVAVQVCGENRSQVVRLERAAGGSGWDARTVGEPMSGQQRLRAETTTDGTDVLYLSAPLHERTQGVLRHASIPRGSVAETGGSSLQDIVSALRGDLGGTNVALGATVTVSSTLRTDTGGELAVDGDCTDASRWISAVGDTAPNITAAWQAPTELSAVRVHSGYAGGDNVASVLRDFTIEVHTATGWIEVGRFDDNRLGSVVAEIDGLVADQVRLLITDPSASATDVARVFEIEAIAAEPAPAATERTQAVGNDHDPR